MRYAKWSVNRRVSPVRWSATSRIPTALSSHVVFAQRLLSRSGIDISDTMRRHQLKLADRQCRMSALSSRIQDAVVMLVTSLYAARCQDPTTQLAAEVVCQELRNRITGNLPSDLDFRRVTQLGGKIAQEGWSELDQVSAGKILQPYS